MVLRENLGDWGYGLTLPLKEARDGWLRPWLLEAAGGYWLGPDGGGGIGVLEGPHGLEGRLWHLGPVRAFRVFAPEREAGDPPADEPTSSGPGASVELPEGVYKVVRVHEGVVWLRPETPMDMPCGEAPTDSTSRAGDVPVYRTPLSRLLDASGRPRSEVAYPKGC